MKRGIFITATGTDVGKTYVAALLLKKLRGQGIDAGYYKPALSGAERIGNELVPGDAVWVQKVALLPEEPAELVSFIYEPPLSPHLAGSLTGREVEAETIARDFQAARARHVFTVVEGCGGLACPLRMGEKPLLTHDIVRMMDLDCLIVADAGLGAIHAALSTYAFAQICRLPVRGFILNRYRIGELMHEDNRTQIERLSGLPVLGYAAADAGDIVMDIKSLL